MDNKIEFTVVARIDFVAALTDENGRSIDVDDWFALAADWAKEEYPEKSLAHAGHGEFCRRLSRIKRVQEPLALFRGVGFAKLAQIPELLGPPAKDQCIDNRYNKAHVPVLYLCDSEDGVAREVQVEPNSQLWVQDYQLSTRGLKIADFKATGDSFLEPAFHFAEKCGLPLRGGPRNYILSQLLAEIVGRDFDGMRVRGVRGDPALHYCNVVMFRPEKWRDWVRQGSPPRPVED